MYVKVSLHVFYRSYIIRSHSPSQHTFKKWHMAQSQDEYKKDCYDDYSIILVTHNISTNMFLRILKQIIWSWSVGKHTWAQEKCGVLKAMPHNFFKKILWVPWDLHKFEKKIKIFWPPYFFSEMVTLSLHIHNFCPGSYTVISETLFKQDNEIHDNPDVASVEFALMVQREAIRQIQRWFFEDTAHYFHSHITKEIIVSSLLSSFV